MAYVGLNPVMPGRAFAPSWARLSAPWSSSLSQSRDARESVRAHSGEWDRSEVLAQSQSRDARESVRAMNDVYDAVNHGVDVSIP